MKVQEIHTIDVDTLQIHPVAEATPLMVTEQYEALKASIEIRGQQEPGLIYRNRLIDGRHRLKALIELGEKTMNVVKLPNNTTVNELEDLVATSEVGRHQTPTQLAIFAFYGFKSGRYESLKEAAVSVGTSERQVLRAKKIEINFNRPDLIDILYNGGKVATGNGKSTTSSLATIENMLKLFKASQGPDNTGITPRTEPTEDEELLIGKILSRVGQESVFCQQALASRLYSQVKQHEETIAVRDIPDTEQQEYARDVREVLANV